MAVFKEDSVYSCYDIVKLLGHRIDQGWAAREADRQKASTKTLQEKLQEGGRRIISGVLRDLRDKGYLRIVHFKKRGVHKHKVAYYSLSQDETVVDCGELTLVKRSDQIGIWTKDEPPTLIAYFNDSRRKEITEAIRIWNVKTKSYWRTRQKRVRDN